MVRGRQTWIESMLNWPRLFFFLQLLADSVYPCPKKYIPGKHGLATGEGQEDTGKVIKSLRAHKP